MTRGVVDERRGIQTPEVSEREWQEGGKRKLSRNAGDGGESMTYAEVGSARDSAQFPASLANDQQRPEGG